MVTVPCPNGHPMTTPYGTMGEEVLCPHCGAQFTLTYTNSLEYQTEKQIKQSTEAHKLGKRWFTWAVVAACAVLIMLIVLIVMAIQ